MPLWCEKLGSADSVGLHMIQVPGELCPRPGKLVEAKTSFKRNYQFPSPLGHQNLFRSHYMGIYSCLVNLVDNLSQLFRAFVTAKQDFAERLLLYRCLN